MMGALPYRMDGPLTRLCPDAVRSLAAGPGQHGRDGVSDSILWAAGIGIGEVDYLRVFWDEVGGIGWLDGFLCDAEITELFETLANPSEEAEEPEELFSKSSMNTLGSDVVDDY